MMGDRTLFHYCITIKFIVMDYYVVLFDEYTSLVPNTWVNIETKIVAWPPGPVTHAKMKNLTPTTNWMEYQYKKIMGPFDFEKAKHIEEQTINCSTNEDTDDLIEKSQETTGGKRTIKATKKFSSSDENDEEEESDEDDDSVPPKKKTKRIPNKKNTYPDLPNLVMPPKPNYGSLKPSSKSNNTSNKVIPPTITSTNNNHSTPEGQDIVDEEVVDATKGTNDNEVQVTSPPGTSNDSGGLNEKQQPKGIKKTPTKLDNKKKNAIDTVRKKKLKELLVKELVSDEDVDIEEDDEFENIFPLTTVEDLNNFDATLKADANTRKKLKTKLQKVGGPSITRHTNKCLERMMTDDLAVLYSYSGQSRGQNQQYKTLAFNKLKLFKVLRDAIVSTKFNYTESDFIKVLSRWLNGAKARVKKRTATPEEEIEE